jgi:hypothetical protein
VDFITSRGAILDNQKFFRLAFFVILEEDQARAQAARWSVAAYTPLVSEEPAVNAQH